jgi:hypothetical protein
MKFSRREEGRSSLRALLKPPSCIYAASRAGEPEKLAKFAPSSESWVNNGQMADENRLVDADAIADDLGVERKVVLRLARQQLIPAIRISRKIIRFNRQYPSYQLHG